MITITRGLAVGVVLAGAAIGLAGPASAHLTEGSYTRTMTSGNGPAGVHTTSVLTSCGQDCMTAKFSNGDTLDFHLQGATWAGTDASSQCAWSIDDNSLAGNVNCPDGSRYGWQWAKNG